MISRLILFLLINFGALAIGGFFTNQGVNSDWYLNLAKAPWTPPGWVFGAAWTFIMICFAIYMAYLWDTTPVKTSLVALFGVQLILNVIWNPVFFKYQQVFLGLLLISTLTLVVGLFFFRYLNVLKIKSILILPYLIWLLVASSLNAYIFFKN